MGGGSKETVTKTEPWGPAQDYYKELFGKAKTAFDATNGKYWTGERTAGPNDMQKSAVNQVAGLAPTLSAGAQPLQNLALSQIRGDWLSPDSNPFIKAVASAALEPVQQGFNANKLALNDKAISQGAYGGARQDLQQNQLADDYTKTAGNITSGIYGQNYANERNIMQNSGNLLDQANSLFLAGPTALANAGDVKRGWDQQAIDDKRAQFDDSLKAPWAGIPELAQVLGSTGASQTTQIKPQANPLLSILQGVMGGGMTGASLASGIGGVAAGAGMGAFAPWMIPLALMGGLAGGLN